MAIQYSTEEIRTLPRVHTMLDTDTLLALPRLR